MDSDRASRAASSICRVRAWVIRSRAWLGETALALSWSSGLGPVVGGDDVEGLGDQPTWHIVLGQVGQELGDIIAVCVVELRFADLFCGIGGFHVAARNLWLDAVFACDIDAEVIGVRSVNIFNIMTRLRQPAYPGKRGPRRLAVPVPP